MTNNEHAFQTNPCQGICVMEDELCFACFRSYDERSNWFNETNEWRELVLKEIVKRKEIIFGKGE